MRLFGCYRASEASDPETFVAMATAVVSEYPEQIVRRVAYGLPLRSKWLPAVAEIREACEREMASIRAAAARQIRRAETASVIGTPRNRTPEERARVAARAAELRAMAADREEGSKPFSLRLRPGVDAFAERGPIQTSPMFRRALAASLGALENDSP